jgi:hypothetical protein
VQKQNRGTLANSLISDPEAANLDFAQHVFLVITRRARGQAKTRSATA